MKIFLDKKIQQVNVLDERFYTDNSKNELGETIYYPSVTTVLNAYPKGFGFEEWLRNTGQNSKTILKEAGEQGSNVHNAIDDFLKGAELQWIGEGGMEMYTLLEWQMITRFMEFFQNVDKTEFLTEQTLFSHNMRLGGTMDLVCKMGGELWLLDYKTSNSIHKTHQLQLAAYKKMYEELTGDKIDRYGVLWLKAATRTDKPPTQGKGWQIKEFTKTYDHDIKLYHHTRALWDEENPNYKPKNLQYPNKYKL